MSAGTGVQHSEINPSDTETHLLQIWILPDTIGLEPGYEQKLFDRGAKLNRWCLVGSRDGRDGSLTIHQDVLVSSAIVESGGTLEYDGGTDRRAFLQVVSGTLELGDETISAGDGVAMERVGHFSIHAVDESELLLFDMA